MKLTSWAKAVNVSEVDDLLHVFSSDAGPLGQQWSSVTSSMIQHDSRLIAVPRCQRRDGSCCSKWQYRVGFNVAVLSYIAGRRIVTLG